MAAPRPPRPRATGGRTLMLLGVLLALAAGTIVIYIVSQATSTGPQQTTAVVAKIDLPANIVLSATQKNAPYMLITDAFEAKQVPVDVAPDDAYAFVSQLDLDAKLNNYVITGQFLKGEFLRKQDRRLTQVGTGGIGSLTNINPPQLANNQVLFVVDIAGGGKPVAVAGDHVDFVVLECFQAANTGQQTCEAQTTLQD